MVHSYVSKYRKHLILLHCVWPEFVQQMRCMYVQYRFCQKFIIKRHALGFQNSTNEIVVAVGKAGEVPLEYVFMAG